SAVRPNHLPRSPSQRYRGCKVRRDALRAQVTAARAPSHTSQQAEAGEGSKASHPAFATRKRRACPARQCPRHPSRPRTCRHPPRTDLCANRKQRRPRQDARPARQSRRALAGARRPGRQNGQVNLPEELSGSACAAGEEAARPVRRTRRAGHARPRRSGSRCPKRSAACVRRRKATSRCCSRPSAAAPRPHGARSAPNASKAASPAV
ncbi:hypothetical protein C2E23DRAFT_902179, partial [Lenzites betulinus]